MMSGNSKTARKESDDGAKLLRQNSDEVVNRREKEQYATTNGERTASKSPRRLNRSKSEYISASPYRHPMGNLSPILSREESFVQEHDCPSGGGNRAKAIPEEGYLRSPTNWNDLPVHKQQLYRLFGKTNADYFLYPKMELVRKKEIPIPNAMRKVGGRSGADPLWDILRDQSKKRLEFADSQIPSELKKAYSAFIREYLTQTKPSARSKFYADKDLPPQERLEDSRYHEHVREIRHRLELMYRSSLANEDKTNVLMHNNPIPDLNNLDGDEGPLRYYPSWLDQYEESVEEEPQYKKWLPPPENISTRFPPPSDPEPSISQQHSAGTHTKRSKKKSMVPRLSFLTDEDAKSEGRFWRNRKDPTIPSENIPGRKIMAEVEQAEMANKDVSFQGSRSASSSSRSRTAPPSFSSRGDGSWQPLTMTAVGERKPTVHLMSSGDFNFGRQAMWRPVIATKTH